jgi:hypothetical protein
MAKNTPQVQNPIGEEIVDGAASAPAKTGLSFKTVKNVTLPIYKLKEGVAGFVQFKTPFVLGKKLEGSKMEPAHVAHVVDLETGELHALIGGKVLLGILEDDYADAAYVGKQFQLLIEKPETFEGGRKYNRYTVTEIEVA